ncbi:MAG: orotidine-5'-phosphate decarboxylase [Syntrophobacterales bacterium]|jgi:orotidine-5'-phosphate decarboxylase|nr:orotidine-5'-phosphate decarboxylase [Syntrophobacterales bacterium]
MNNRKGIIFAADIREKEKLVETIKLVSPYVEAIKIGNIAFYSYGFAIIELLKKYTEKPIIADIKLMDIPYVAEIICQNALNCGADGIMVCGPVGGDTIYVCREIFYEKIVIVFTEFSHPSGLISDEMADEYIEIADILKCDGIQIPATRPDRILEVRKRIGDKLMIFSCGVGEQGPVIGSAIQAGADYEIIGRAIYSPRECDISPGEAAKLAKSAINIIENRIHSIFNSEKKCPEVFSTYLK